ncbi:ROK family protein [Alkalicoccus chagannorensis]|uniref:ROK family protein n=1 Tax=Alkalicoccus chagannorensis TaxID=427072 RepID=UPI00040675F1|nr:ROK family protein [Alkalicoccus chagannorensis]
MSRIGIDIGGTTIKAALVSNDGRVEDFCSAATPDRPDEAVKKVQGWLEGWLQEAPGAVGMAAPGPLDPDRGIFLDPPNLPGWHGFPIVEKMQKAIPRTFLLENDANAAAVGEYLAGAGAGAASMVFITISTGVGGGIVNGDRLLVGADRNAAEIGNMIIADESPEQEGMNQGAWESLASGTALQAKALEAGYATAAALTEAAGRGEEAALPVVAEWSEWTARGLANIIHTVNPERLILGGGVMNAAEVLLPLIKQRLDSKVYESLRGRVVIRPAALGSHAGVIGASMLERMQQQR